MKSGNLNFLEPSGPLQACNGTDLPHSTGKRHLKIHHGLQVYETAFNLSVIPLRHYLKKYEHDLTYVSNNQTADNVPLEQGVYQLTRSRLRW